MFAPAATKKYLDVYQRLMAATISTSRVGGGAKNLIVVDRPFIHLQSEAPEPDCWVVFTRGRDGCDHELYKSYIQEIIDHNQDSLTNQPNTYCLSDNTLSTMFFMSTNNPIIPAVLSQE